MFILCEECRFERPDLFVHVRDRAQLSFNDGPHVRPKRLLQHALVRIFRDILAPFTFDENAGFITAFYRGFDIDPAAVELRDEGTRMFGISAKRADERLQLADEMRPLDRAFCKKLLQFSGLNAFGCAAITCFAVLASYDQLVQP